MLDARLQAKISTGRNIPAPSPWLEYELYDWQEYLCTCGEMTEPQDEYCRGCGEPVVVGAAQI